MSANEDWRDMACEPDAQPFYACYQCGGAYRHGEAVNGCCSERCNETRKREFRERQERS